MIPTEHVHHHNKNFESMITELGKKFRIISQNIIYFRFLRWKFSCMLHYWEIYVIVTLTTGLNHGQLFPLV